MNSATTAARPIPTPVLVRNFCDSKVAEVSANRPHGTVPATVRLIAEAPGMSFSLNMRPNQARDLATVLRMFADHTDELQTIADELAQQVQP